MPCMLLRRKYRRHAGGFRKYFHRSPEQLSWAEAAFLAILPNAPALKNRQMLKEKRDGLLKKLHKKNG